MPYTRTRSQDDRRYEVALCDWIPPFPSAPVLNQANGGTFVGQIKTIHDNVNTGYRQNRKNPDACIMNDVLIERRVVTSGNSVLVAGPHGAGFTTIHYGNYGDMFLACTPRPDLPYLDQERMANLALTKAMAKAKSAAVLGGEVLGDFSRTLGMLRRPFGNASQLLKKMTAYKKRRMAKSAKAAARAASSAWLEYRYGWQPIIIDGKKIIDGAMYEFDKARSRYLVARASEDYSFAKSVDFEDVNADGILLSGTVTVSERQKSSAGVRYKIQPETIYSHSQQMFGARASDIPATVWERIPYSFVCDWFANVGSYLQASVPVPGLEVVGSWVTDVHYVITDVKGSWYRTLDGQHFSNTFSPVQFLINNVSRNAHPQMSWHPVLTGTPLSRLHTVDGLALLAGKILSGLKEFGH